MSLTRRARRADGFGRSEELLRDCIAKSERPPSDVVVATKFAPLPWRRRGSSDVVKACRASAARLGVESIDLYQVHFPSAAVDALKPMKVFGVPELSDESVWDGLAACYHEGLVRNIGTSNYGPGLLRRCIDELGARGVPLASNQVRARAAGGPRVALWGWC